LRFSFNETRITKLFGLGFEMRVLVVEDEKKLASYIEKGLKEAGFVVDRAENGNDGLQMALRNSYDTAVVDLMLPQLDGFTLIERMRAEKVLTPVLILSAKRSVDDRIRGLQTGGDDYLTKPFSFAELLARIQALIRRATHESEPTSLTLGDLSMDLLRREVLRSGVKIELQPREFALLEYLMRNHGRVVSKTMIIEHVWGYGFDPLTNIVDVLISRLRNKVDHDFDQKLIHTFRGVGYALKVS
jgi:two-component system, OmpR family, response regulator